ncbi:MAG TPA: gephyrin-like molybdotransferase Glp [Microbacterium sp.]|nr:gephyrin-like molybdotransferase Glp [Microbacterium sp.]
MHRIAVEDYAAIIRELLEPLRNRVDEPVPIALAAGRVTAGEVVSPIDLPIFRNSQMDGYAVHADDLRELPVLLPVVGEIAAGGRDPAALPVGSAVAIMTGAPVPRGADAVVPIEDTRMVDGSVEIARGRDAGEYVREPGSDITAGAFLLPAGLRLAPRHLAALAAANLIDVAVRSRVRVAVVSTGNELVPPGTPLENGRLPDANGIALAAAASAVGADVIDVQLAGDDPGRLATVFDRAIAAGAELILTSGGISMGAHEPVRQLLEPLGATVGTVDMQPGGPQAYARYRGVPVICFPGNPVSSQLSFALFVAPVLRELAAQPPVLRTTRPLAHPLRSVAGRRQFLRGRLTGDGSVETVAGPGSHLVAGLAAADVLLDVPADVTALPEAAAVDTVDL